VLCRQLAHPPAQFDSCCALAKWTMARGNAASPIRGGNGAWGICRRGLSRKTVSSEEGSPWAIRTTPPQDRESNRPEAAWACSTCARRCPFYSRGHRRQLGFAARLYVCPVRMRLQSSMKKLGRLFALDAEAGDRSPYTVCSHIPSCLQEEMDSPFCCSPSVSRCGCRRSDAC
jgi:hypothetical protein